jgi:elongation factor Ts
MTDISVAEIKRLRQLTGAGMQDCKKALAEAEGDFDAAVEILRVKYAAKVDRKSAERTAANGLVTLAGHSLVELKCETDFVAKNEQFKSLADEVAAAVDAAAAASTEAAAAVPMGEETVAERIRSSAAMIGEKVELGRVARVEGTVTSYMHRKSPDLPPQVGVLLAYEGDDAELARSVAMQVAAMRPTYLSVDDVPAAVVEKERQVAEETAREEGKPEKAWPSIIKGRVNGFFKDSVLLEQPSVQDSKKTVKTLLSEAGLTVTGFAHLEIGQG